MLSSNSPYKLTVAFAESGDKNTIPLTGDAAAGVAAYDTGFPPVTMLPLASGGIPPDGMDMNGILYALSDSARWAAAAGLYTYDSTFQAAIGGYPLGAIVRAVGGDGLWLSVAENNMAVPGIASYANWLPMAFVGVTSRTIASSGDGLTALEAARPIIRFTGTFTGTRNALFPPRTGRWLIVNAVAGGGTMGVKLTGGSVVLTIPNGAVIPVCSYDGVEMAFETDGA